MIKALALKIFKKFLKHQEIELFLSNWLRKKQQKIPELVNKESPYNKSIEISDDTCQRSDIIFITGRFRSGSTLLWNMFRQLPSCTSYYEPFNERQWFNPITRGNTTDKTHLNVDGYWQEYDGLEHLAKFYQEDWIKQSLHMDEQSYNSDMKSYISELIEATTLRPVLQFNRIDFRLPWIKQSFPNAKILHVFRNPREQWFSTLHDKESPSEQNYKDGYYLDLWCEDLKYHFPFLDKEKSKHPYQRFYYLWKLSYLYGCKFSDLSIQFEQLVTNSEFIGKQILKTINLDVSFEKFTKVIKQPIKNKWKTYADEQWFSKLEQECEMQLCIFLRAQEDG